MIRFEALWRMVSVLTRSGPAGLLLGIAGALAGVLTESGPAGLLVGAGAVAGVLLVTVLTASVLLGGRVTVTGPGASRRWLRERARRTGVPRYRDPDADGRTRPRGPTAALAAA